MNINVGIDFREVRELFNSYRNAYLSCTNYTKLQANCEIWSAGIKHEIEPHELNRMGLVPGKVLKSTPRSHNKKCRHLFDSGGNMIYRGMGTEIAGCVYEEFFFHFKCRIESAYFGASKSKELLNAKIRTISDRKLVNIITCAKYGNRFENFIYDGETLKTIEVFEFPLPGNVISHNMKTVIQIENNGAVSMPEKFMF